MSIVNMTVSQTKQVEDALIEGHPYVDPDQGGGIDKMRWFHDPSTTMGGEDERWYLQVSPRRNINGVGEWTDYSTDYQQVRSPSDELYLQPGIIPARKRIDELQTMERVA